MAGKLRVTQVRSTISHIGRNRATVRALGLKRIGHTVEVADNEATRGMVRQVRFLVSVEEIGEEKKGRRSRSEGAQDAGDAPAGRPAEDAAASPEETA